MAQESPSTEYLYDILYADKDRLISYLGQVDPNGILTSLKLVAGEKDSESGEGGVNLHVAKGKLAASSENSSGQERTFDPSSLIPISVMNKLDELGYIEKGLQGAQLGSLTILKGYLKIKNFSQMESLWPILEHFVGNNISVDHPPEGLSKPEIATWRKNQLPLQTKKKVVFNLLKSTPQPIQVEFMSETGLCWSTIIPENLTIPIEDIMLKHGNVLPGHWILLSIVDAIPQFSNDGEVLDWNRIWSDNVSLNEFTDGVTQMYTSVKELFGRPSKVHGVTPLIIFREVPLGQHVDHELSASDGSPNEGKSED